MFFLNNIMTMGADVGAFDNLSTAVTTILGWVGSTVTTISSNPLLLISLAIFIIGACIGLAKRLMGN